VDKCIKTVKVGELKPAKKKLKIQPKPKLAGLVSWAKRSQSRSVR
jgi:hypothetical protein